jgi:hypothetical protein
MAGPAFPIAAVLEPKQTGANEEPAAMTDLELEEMARRCEQVTPGPWVSYIEGRDHTSGDSFIKANGLDRYLQGGTDADRYFIANARQDLPALIAEVRRLRAGQRL